MANMVINIDYNMNDESSLLRTFVIVFVSQNDQKMKSYSKAIDLQ